MNTTVVESLSLLINVLRDYRLLKGSINRFNRAIDIVEWITYDDRIRGHVSESQLCTMRDEVMSCSPDLCPKDIFLTEESCLRMGLENTAEIVDAGISAL
ncbi:hypothetical protein AKO1_011038 [Acrasis kona]|uniref:Uncharacterized protein n=1 Tax=Acrasis kona TaxID=1008807 RepID=A0AAW2YTY8_9EUKA